MGTEQISQQQQSEILDLLSSWFPEHSEFLKDNREHLNRYYHNPSEENEKDIAKQIELFFDQHIRGTELATIAETSPDREAFDAKHYSECELAIVRFSLSFVSLLLSAFGATIPARLHDSKTVIELILTYAEKLTPLIMELTTTEDPAKRVRTLFKIISVFSEVGILGKIFNVVVEEMGYLERAWFVTKVALVIAAGIITGGGALFVQLALLVGSAVECIVIAFEVDKHCC